MYLSKIKNISTETYSFDLIFWNNDHFQDDKVRISPQKMDFEVWKCPIFDGSPVFQLKNIDFSPEYVEFHGKIY